MPTIKLQSVPVSKRTVLNRISRRLADTGVVLKGLRGRGPRGHFLLNTKTSTIEFIEPEAYARKNGWLSSWEEVVG